MSRELLKEAIADAKAVKEAAIANAKAALEEAFTPHLKELLASKLESLEESEDMDEMKKRMMEDEDMDDTMEGMGKGDLEELDLEEILAELDGLDEKKIKTARQTDNRDAEEEDDPFDMGKTKHQPMDEAKKKEEDSEEESEKKGDNELVGEMTEDELKKLIMSVFDEMGVEAGPGGEGDMEDLESDMMAGDEAEAGADEEIDLEELMLEMKKEMEMNEYVEGGASSENALLKAVDAAIAKGGELAKKLKKVLASGGGGWQQGGIYEDYLREYVEGGASSENALLKAVDAAIAKGGDLAKKLKNLFAQGGGGWQQGGIYEEDEAPMNEMQGGAELAGALQILAGMVAGGVTLAVAIEKAKAKFPKVKGFLDNLGSAAGRSADNKAGLGDKSSDMSKMDEMRNELNEAYSTIKTLRSDLNDVNLLNAKLLYTNKIFKAKNLTESQKVKVLSTFDKAATVKEVKLVFESLSTSIATSNNTTKAPIKESMGFASKASGIVKNSQTIETDAVIARMKKLAGL